MMNHLKKVFISVSLTSLLFSASYAASWVNTEKNIQGLDKVLKEIKQKNKNISMRVPTQIPDSKKSYYASYSARKNFLALNIDATANCHGVHNCNIGSITAETLGEPKIQYDMQNHEITVPVTLKNDTHAYYTPGHAMGDYWPPMIQWREGSTLYTLTWQIANSADEKSTLVEMANSMSRN
ncbi:MAG: hypothetical protein JSS53_04890 [Proteobacteria bacterium]|nr:hypothetical protein [Pseudomonadota bacterium]